MEESTARASVAGGPSGIALSHGLGPKPIRFPSPRVASLSLEPESLPSNATTGNRSHSRQPNVNIISSSPAESTLSSTSTISDSTAIPNSPAFSTRTLRPKPRPSLPRPDSKIYDSLPFEAPHTPWSENPPQDDSWLAFFGMSSLSSQHRHTEEEGRNGNGARSDLERQSLLGQGRSTESGHVSERRDSDVELFAGRKEGLPKLSRECLISEIKCYGKHMLPPILFFVVFVLGFGLWLYNKQRGGN